MDCPYGTHAPSRTQLEHSIGKLTSTINPCTKPTTEAKAVEPSTKTHRPSDNVMSTRLADKADVGVADAASVTSTTDGAATLT